jgi:hypothetical protein
MEAKPLAKEVCAAPAALERLAVAGQRAADLAQLTQILRQSTQALLIDQDGAMLSVQTRWRISRAPQSAPP